MDTKQQHVDMAREDENETLRLRGNRNDKVNVVLFMRKTRYNNSLFTSEK